MESKNDELFFLNRNKGKNYLIVEDLNMNEVPLTDNFVVITRKKMEELNLYTNETVILKGRKGKTLIRNVLPDKSNSLSDNKIRLEKAGRKRLGVKIGDYISIIKSGIIAAGYRVKILPFEDSIKGKSKNEIENLTKNYLIPYFKDAYRAVKKGEIIDIRDVSFKIVECDPEPCIVCPQTIIFDEGEPIKKEDEEKNKVVGFIDFGGYKKQLSSLIEIVEFSLNGNELFSNLGMKPVKGILLYGNHGTGKSLLTKVISNEIECFAFFINAKEVILKNFEEAENSLRIAFSMAEQNNPSIILIDDIELIAKKNKIKNEFEMKILSLLTILMDNLSSDSKIIVIGTTANIEDIEPGLRTNERFSKEIEIGIPNENERLEILKIHTEKMKLKEDIDLKKIASLTENFVGSDLVQICNEAGHQCAIENMNDINKNVGLDEEEKKKECLDSMKISNENFIFAIEQKKNLKKKKIEDIEKENCELKERISILEAQLEKYQKLEENKK